MKYRTLALLGTGGILYRKELREYSGSVTASLLMQQLDFWFQHHPDGFYKFLEPTPKHPDYKDGDSWIEELGFSKSEFRFAFDNIGVRHGSKTAYAKTKDPFIMPEGKDKGKEMFYCSYHDRKNGLTWYFRNHEAVDRCIELLVAAKPITKYPRRQSTVDKTSAIPVVLPIDPQIDPVPESTVNQQTESTVNQQTEFIEINKLDLHKSGNSIYINQESEFTFIYRDHSEITSEITAKPPFIVPQDAKLAQGERENSPQAIAYLNPEILEPLQDPARTQKTKSNTLPSNHDPLVEIILPASKNENQSQYQANNGFKPSTGKNQATGKDYLPWQGTITDGKGIARTGDNPEFLAFVAKSICKYQNFKSLSLGELRRETVKYVHRAQSNSDRLAEIQEYWRDFCNLEQLPDVSVRDVEQATTAQNLLEMLKGVSQ